MSEQPQQEGSPWFWKLFGSAIIGMVTILVVTLLNVINNANHQSKTDLSVSIQEIRNDIKNLNNDFAQQKEKLSSLENAKYNEEIDHIRRKLEEVERVVVSRNEKIAAIESTIQALKEKVTEDGTNNKELSVKIIELEHELKRLKEKSEEIKIDTEAKKTALLR